MWGKLTEINNRTNSKMISDPYEMYRFLLTPCIEFTNLMFASDDVLWASWRFIEEEMIPNLRNTNDVIGAYVTAAARLYLYSYLDRLGERTLYCDTDSFLFVKPRDEPALVETGDNLGAMTSEMRPFEFIEEYVSGGPINFAYKIVNTTRGERKTVCKVRGIALNYNASQLINFDVIKDTILENPEGEHVIVHTENKIKRKKKAGGGDVSIITEPEDKLYRISFFKKRLLQENTSVPYGYK